MTFKTIALGAAAFTSLTAHAATPYDFDFSSDMGDENYKEIVEPIINPMRHMFLTPPKGDGVLGFDLGLAATAVDIPSKTRELATQHVNAGKDIPKTLILPRLTAQKGLPFGLDVGVNFVMVPGSNIKLVGAGLQYQMGLPIPLLAVAARVGYSALLGLDELSARHLTLEGLAGFGLPPGVSALINIEPYAGFGMDFASTQSDLAFVINGASKSVTRSADWTETYLLVGTRFSLGFFRLGAEAQVSLDDKPLLISGKGSIGF